MLLGCQTQTGHEWRRRNHSHYLLFPLAKKPIDLQSRGGGARARSSEDKSLGTRWPIAFGGWETAGFTSLLRLSPLKGVGRNWGTEHVKDTLPCPFCGGFRQRVGGASGKGAWSQRARGPPLPPRSASLDGRGIRVRAGFARLLQRSPLVRRAIWCWGRGLSLPPSARPRLPARLRQASGARQRHPWGKTQTQQRRLGRREADSSRRLVSACLAGLLWEKLGQGPPCSVGLRHFCVKAGCDAAVSPSGSRACQLYSFSLLCLRPLDGPGGLEAGGRVQEDP